MHAQRRAAPPHQRADGRAELHFVRRGAVTRLSHLHQAAPLRFLFPTPEPREPPVAALVNTAGGLAGGDAVATEVRLGAGALACVTTPAAEKVYRSLGPPTRIDVRLDLAAGATLEWLPQETILFDGARLERGLAATLAPGARLLLSEMIVFGRRARGERMRAGGLVDAWRIRQGAAALWADGITLEGDLAERLDHPFGFAGAEAMATLLLVASGPLEPLRDALRAEGVAASLPRPGLLLARWLGAAAPLREALGAGIRRLRAAAFGLPPALPRLWTS
jgi:urease accessory protein